MEQIAQFIWWNFTVVASAIFCFYQIKKVGEAKQESNERLEYFKKFYGVPVNDPHYDYRAEMLVLFFALALFVFFCYMFISFCGELCLS